MRASTALSAQISVVALIVGTAVGAGLMTLPLLTQGLPLSTLFTLLFLSYLLMYQAACFWIELGEQGGTEDNLSSYVTRYAPWLYWPTKIVYGAFFWTLLAFYLDNIPIFLDPFFSQLPQTALSAVSLLLIGFYLMLPAYWQGRMNNLFVHLMLLLLLDVFLSGWNSGITSLPISGDNPFPWRLLVPMMMFFGYHLTIPSLKTHVTDSSTLRRLCAFSGAFVLLLYLCWSLILMGLISQQGIAFAAASPQDFLRHLAEILPHAGTIPSSANLFSVLAVLTSCFGMALGMRDYLKDILGPKLPLSVSVALTLIPSVLLMACCDGSLVLLEYAAHFALFLLLGVPSWLVFKQRQKQRLWPLLFCVLSGGLFVLL